jgi:CO dehydrogenase nickel-insertion accessory protein CooC1
MSKRSIIINGAGGVGKNSFVAFVAEHLKKQYGIDCFDISSVDEIKRIAIQLGWDGVKDYAGRKFLSDLKDFSTAYNNGPFNYMLNRFLNGPSGLYFFHIREPEEIEKFKQTIPSKTMLVVRHIEQYNNHADDCVNDYKYDYLIPNYCNLERLKETAIQWCDEIYK